MSGGGGGATTNSTATTPATNSAAGGRATKGRPPGKVFKKCKSATFQIDGATYTIVASSEDGVDARRSDDGSAADSRRPLDDTAVLSVRRREIHSDDGRRSPAPATAAIPTALPSSDDGDNDASASLPSADELPAADAADACCAAALRLRALLTQLDGGCVSADMLRQSLQYATRVLEAAAATDETRRPRGTTSGGQRPVVSVGLVADRTRQPLQTPPVPPRNRAADEDDELSEVRQDAVPAEVREWLASTFTRRTAGGARGRRADEKPRFRSVAHAIRAGIFVDRMYRRIGQPAATQYPAEVVRALRGLDEWSFDVFAVAEAGSGQALRYVGNELLLNRYGLAHKFKVPPTVMDAFLTHIEDGYGRHSNPYHNSVHAADVTQTVHYILYRAGLASWMTDLEIFAALVAAIVHDYEHTGTTNGFHVMAGTSTALLYNDRAVLENHHVSAAFRLMADDAACNVAAGLTREEHREFRALVIDMVLGTDMSIHFQQLKGMRATLSGIVGAASAALASTGTTTQPSAAAGTTTGQPPVTVDRTRALALVLHTCDISHPAKRWSLHRRWTGLLLDEFFRQGDMEHELGLPFSPLCDRNNTLVAESQIGFIEFIVEPSMQVCGDMLEVILAPATTHPHTDEPNEPFTLPKPWLECLAENKGRWKEQATKDAEQRAKQQQQEQ